MFTKLLVPTDLSTDSRAGMKFAIQFAAQSNAKLFFYNTVVVLKPTSWSAAKFEAFEKNELAAAQQTLAKFVDDVYNKIDLPKGKFQCVVENTANIAESIIAYAVNNKLDGICMGTRGAGKLKRLIGTNASKVITTSPLPVFIIPKNYQIGANSKIFYASDLSDLKKELKQVSSISNDIDSDIAVYHYHMLEKDEEAAQFKKISAEYKIPRTEFTFQKLKGASGFTEQVTKDVKKSGASFAILFTRQDRDWFEKITMSSQSAELAFQSKVPLLVIPKSKQ